MLTNLSPLKNPFEPRFNVSISRLMKRDRLFVRIDASPLSIKLLPVRFKVKSCREVDGKALRI